MELLKDYEHNLKYKMVTTKDNCVIICFYKFNTYSREKYSEAEVVTLTNSTREMVDLALTEALHNKKELIKQTIIKTRYTDLYGIDRFNNDIVEYLDARPNTKEIHLINSNPEFEILFEPKVFQAMCRNSNRLVIELGDGGFRTDSTPFDNIEYLEFVDGNWLISSDCTVTIKDLVIRNGTINTYNKSERVSNSLNIIIGNSFTGSIVNVYSTIRVNIQYSSEVFGTSYSSSRMNISFFNIYGQEVTSDDYNDHRFNIFGFNRVNLGDIDIRDEVQHGNLIYIHNVNNAIICSVHRYVTTTNRPGNVILVEEVGSFKIHNINYITDEKSFVYADSSILKIISKKESELKKSFQIYDTTVENNANNRITILDVVDTKLDLLYLADCKIGSNIDVFREIGDSEVKRISYSNVSLSCEGSLAFDHSSELSFFQCNVDVKHILSTNIPKMAFIESTLKFEKFNIDYNKGNIPKCTFDNSQIIGKRLQFFNNSTEEESKANIVDTKVFVDTINIDNYTLAITNGIIKCKNFKTYGKSTSFDSSVLSFCENSSETNYTINSSVTGKIVLDDYSDDNIMNFTIEDKQFYFTTSSLDIIALVKNPKFTLSTNTPLNVNIERIYTNSINFKLLKTYDFETKCKIIKHLNYDNVLQDFKIINDSELISEINKHTDELGQTIFEIGLKEPIEEE